MEKPFHFNIPNTEILLHAVLKPRIICSVEDEKAPGWGETFILQHKSEKTSAAQTWLLIIKDVQKG